MQQHQREQAVHLGLVGHQLGERAAEPQRLGASSVAAAAVALVEDQVDDRQHGGEAVGQQVVGRHAERDAGRLDLALGAHEPLGHRRPRARGRRAAISAVVSPPSVRSVSATCASRASAGWQQVKTSSRRSSGKVVVVHRVLHRLGDLEQARASRRSVRSRRMRSIARLRAVVTSQAPGLVGHAVARPALGGDRERLLRGFLGEVEVAEEADQRGEDAAPLVAEGLVEDRYHSTTGRTSIAPPMLAAGILRGHLDGGVEVVGLEEEVAADRLLVSANGPSVVERPAVLHAHGGGGVGRLHRRPGVTPGSR